MLSKIHNFFIFLAICFVFPLIFVICVRGMTLFLRGYPILQLIIWGGVFFIGLLIIHIDRYFMYVLCGVCFITLVVELNFLTSDFPNSRQDKLMYFISLLILNLSVVVSLIARFIYIRSRWSKHKDIDKILLLGLFQTSVCIMFPNYIDMASLDRNDKGWIAIINILMNMEYISFPALYVYEITKPFVRNKNRRKYIRLILKKIKANQIDENQTDNC